MKTIKVKHLPECDFCGPSRSPVIFDAPTTRNSLGRGRWGHMCGACFALFGIDTSVTTKMVLDD